LRKALNGVRAMAISGLWFGSGVSVGLRGVSWDRWDACSVQIPRGHDEAHTEERCWWSQWPGYSSGRKGRPSTHANPPLHGTLSALRLRIRLQAVPYSPP
jgi:hypothetical protein